MWMLCAALAATSGLLAQSKGTVSGMVTDASSGETLIGAAVYIPGTDYGTVTNIYGFFSLTIPQGTHTLEVSYMGFQTFTQQVDLQESVKLEVKLESGGIDMGEAVVQGSTTAEQHVNDVQMSSVTMQMDQIKRIPAFMGEVDVIKAIQLLPGVMAAGEGSSGFHVRGGAVDQNLTLLDESPVYNASHLLGFFSVFNSNAIKELELYKGGIPARYGGRLASVLDIRMKEGNNQRWGAEGGIGTVASRLMVEGPIQKDRGSLLLAGRRTYADVFLLLSKDQDARNSRLYFYDFNWKGNYRLNDNNRFFISGYTGRDVFGFGNQFEFSWGNTTTTARWNHIYHDKLFSNLTLTYSDYDYRLADSGEFGFLWESDITDLTGKLDYTYYFNPANTMEFGASATYRDLNPGFARANAGEDTFEITMDPTKSMEYGAYVSNEHQITDQLSAVYGVRYSMLQNVADGTVYSFDDAYNVTDTTSHTKGVYQTYGGFEPRVGVNYKLNNKSAIKASYNRTRQYVQMATNTTSASPLDVWFSASPNVQPQIADQWAIGYFRNLFDNQVEFSVEAYYKDMQNTIDFANHAQLLLNPLLEGELRFGDSRAYGLEVLFRKQVGKLSGMASYTLSRAERLIPEISDDWYASAYDRTHDVSIVLSYELNDRWMFGANWVYQTGSAVTFPTGRFEYFGELVPVYSDRNAERMPHYHRLDLSATLSPKKNEDRDWHGEWVFSVYNAYNRHNAYAINFVQDEENPGETYAQMTYLLPVIPAVTYNFKF